MDLVPLINNENWRMLKLCLDHSRKTDLKKDKDENTLLHTIATRRATWDFNLMAKLKEHIDINERNSEGKTPLHLAIEANQLETAEELINNGAHVNLLDKKGNSPLYYATISGNIKILQLLCINGVDLRWCDARGDTVVHHAAKYDLRSIIAFFIKKKTDLNVLNRCQQTPLEIAIISKKTEVALVLIEAGANVKLCNTQKEGSLLHKSIQMRNYEVARVLANVSSVAICDSEGRTPLHLAVEDNQLKITKMLLNLGSSLNTSDIDGYTPLHIVVQKGYLDLLDVFIEHAQGGSQDDLRGSIDDRFMSLEVLDHTKATNLGDNILHLLAASEMVEDIKIEIFYSLLRMNLKPLVVQTNRDFKTPLHFAYQVFCRPLITQLVNLGADTEEIDRFGRSAISYCTRPDGGRMRVVGKKNFTRRKMANAVF